MRGGILEVFLLLPFVGHQSAETLDPFLLTQKVANLVSFKVHDQTNVSQAGTKNISVQTAEINLCQSSHLSSGPDCLAEHFSPFFLIRLFLLAAEFFLPVFFPVFLFFSLGFLALVLFFFFRFFNFLETFLLPSVDVLALPDTELAG